MQRINIYRFISCIVTITVSCTAVSHTAATEASRARARDIGIEVGVMETGPLNSITDVPGVRVGHRTLVRGESVRTGVTAVLPHGGNLFLDKVPAAISVGNGFGKLTGSTQVVELGNIETPIVLTNTLGVGTAVEAVVRFVLAQPGNEAVRSVNAVVGETNDGYLNDIRGMHVKGEDVRAAIEAAREGPVEEGSVGAGAGTIVFGFKGGIGTSSRIVPREESTGADTGTGDVKDQKHYTIGVLVQSNFGGLLDINGAPLGRELALKRERESDEGGGSCMIVIATDAPLSPRNLERLARRAFLGLARTGSYMSNGTGDYAIAFSTAYRIPYETGQHVQVPPLVSNDAMTPLFQAVVEATQEAVYNSLFMATTVKGHLGRTIHAIPIGDVLEICRRYNVLNLHRRFTGQKPR
jgi:D-aminopeptidase